MVSGDMLLLFNQSKTVTVIIRLSHPPEHQVVHKPPSRIHPPLVCFQMEDIEELQINQNNIEEFELNDIED